jgi:hypothetical protein
MIKCVNCKNIVEKKFCSFCGEKIVEDKDFDFKNILSQAISSTLNFDTKIFRTFKLLFFYPGKLTNKYINGIRVPFLKPFQLFLISNIIFYLFLSNVGLFRTDSQWFFKEQTKQIDIISEVKTIAKAKNITVDELAILYDNKSKTLSKGFLFILIPIYAFIVLLLNYKKKIPFGKHIIFAIHFFSFFMLISVILGKLLSVFTTKEIYYSSIITFAFIIYNIIAIKTVYKDKWVVSIIKGIIAVLVFLFFINFYRVSFNMISLNNL